jgi:hypothetical protein
LTKSFTLLGRAWKPVGLVVLVLNLVTVVLQVPLNVAGDALSERASSGGVGSVEVVSLLGAGLVLLVANFVLTGVASLGGYWAATRTAAGRPAPLGEAVRFGFRRVGWWLVWSLVAALVVAVGFVLCIVPGIAALVVVSPALAGVVVFEGGRGNVLGRCLELVRPRFWDMLLRGVIVVAGSAVVGLLLAVPTFVVGLVAGSGVLGTIVSSVFAAVVGTPLTVVTTALTLVAYAELRNRHAGVDTGRLDAELG